MRDTYSKKNYKCKCGANLEEFVWESELHKHTFECTKCNKIVGARSLVVRKVAQSTSIRTPTKNR